MRNRLPRLPLGSFHLGYTRSYAEQRCDLCHVALSRETDPAEYAWDNRGRGGGHVLFQYTVAGEGRFEDFDTGQTTAMTPGKGFLAPYPSHSRYWLPAGATWTFFYVIFAGDLALSIVRRLLVRHGPVFDCPVAGPPVALLREVYRAAREGRLADEWSASIAAYRLLMELERYVQAPAAEMPDEIAQARRFLENRYDDPGLALDDAAAVAGYSKYHFGRLFKQYVGATPHAYLLQIRMRRAAELLAETDLPVKEIAARVGFRDYPYFCNVFRRRLRQTPGALRRQRGGG